MLSFFKPFSMALIFSAFVTPVMAQNVPIYGYKVVKEYPHDKTAFTQGLFFRDGQLYESTGRYQQSSVRRIELDSGAVMDKAMMPDDVFGEGMIDWGDKLYSLTWKKQQGYIWDAKTLQQVGTFDYQGEGWGLTKNDSHIIMSDGSATLRFLNPETMKTDHLLPVTIGGKPLRNLNELEWVKGQIWANVWGTNYIVQIDPSNGTVTAVVDMTGILNPPGRMGGNPDVLNGIAVNDEGRLFITGKLWPTLFEIEIVEK